MVLGPRRDKAQRLGRDFTEPAMAFGGTAFERYRRRERLAQRALRILVHQRIKRVRGRRAYVAKHVHDLPHLIIGLALRPPINLPRAARDEPWLLPQDQREFWLELNSNQVVPWGVWAVPPRTIAGDRRVRSCERWEEIIYQLLFSLKANPVKSRPHTMPSAAVCGAATRVSAGAAFAAPVVSKRVRVRAASRRTFSHKTSFSFSTPTGKINGLRRHDSSPPPRATGAFVSNSPEAEEPETEMEAFDVRNLPVAIASFAEQGNTPVGGDDNDVSGSDGGSSDGLSSSTPNRSKRVPKFAVIFASLLAATASLGYLVKLISSNWVSHKGVVDLLYTVVFVDTWANVALTVLVLYFGVTKTVINFSLNAVAAFLRPNHVNSLWWLTLMLLRSRQSVSKIVRSTVWWSLGNQLWSLIPLGIDLMRSDSRTGGTFTAGTSNYLRALLTALFDANGDGVVTTTEVQMWFVGKTLRLLWFFVFLELARWAFSLKSAPSREETKDAQVWDKGDFLSQALRHHFAGLRGDKGVSWDQQARSALIDKSLAVAVYLTTAYSCVNALGVNMNGLLAVGGVSGLAVGFAAQKLVSNCISGALIFITQPFVEGDHVAFGQIDGRVEAVGWHSTRIASIEGTYRVCQIPPYMFADCPPVITHVTWPERLILSFIYRKTGFRTSSRTRTFCRRR